mgnify:CR=1 FL=1
MGLNRLSDTGAPHSADDLATLRRRFIEGAERRSEWPDLESINPSDPGKAVQALGQAGQAYIRTLKWHRRQVGAAIGCVGRTDGPT